MHEGRPGFFNFAQDIIEGWARRTPDNLALWCIDEHGQNERRMTFRELAGLQRRAAAFLADAGLQRGDRVLLMLPRIPQWWIAMLGMIRLGVVPIPGTPILTEKDILYRIEAAGVRGIVTDETCTGKIGSFAGVRIVIGPERSGWTSFDAGLREARDDAPAEPTAADDPGIIYFTSGTAGPPKMALHTQASYGLGHRVTGEHWLDLRAGEVHWVLADPGWGKAAWSALFGPWHMGACVFVQNAPGKFHPKTVLKTLSQFPIATFCSPPTALRLIVHEDFSEYRFKHLRHCVAAGESLTADLFNRWKRATGLDIHEGYGQTETNLLIGNFRSQGHPVKAGSMGRCGIGYEIALLDDSLEPVAAGKEGQVAVRVKPKRPLGLFKEYWRNPAETASKFCDDWYLTGDVARCDAEGYYWFLGRADDVINSASYRIGPFEVESALAEHPAVLESAVVGAPDALRGEIVKAFVVLRPGHEHTETMRRELQEHCKRITAPYKYPRQIEFVAELPKTISGKIRRYELRQRRHVTA